MAVPLKGTVLFIWEHTFLLTFAVWQELILDPAHTYIYTRLLTHTFTQTADLEHLTM